LAIEAPAWHRAAMLDAVPGPEHGKVPAVEIRIAIRALLNKFAGSKMALAGRAVVQKVNALLVGHITTYPNP
jgi:hypothetical protein